MTNTKDTKSAVATIKVSALWMQDHLDVWPENEVPCPDGRYLSGGRLWQGDLDREQLRELAGRCRYYAYSTRQDWDADSDGWRLAQAAKRVLAALSKASLVDYKGKVVL